MQILVGTSTLSNSEARTFFVPQLSLWALFTTSWAVRRAQSPYSVLNQEASENAVGSVGSKKAASSTAMSKISSHSSSGRLCSMIGGTE